MRKEAIELHNKAIDKGFKKSPFVSKMWGGMEYVYNISDQNINYVLCDIQKWLREKHNIVVYVEVISSQFLFYRAVLNRENENRDKNMWEYLSNDTGSNYEEVLEIGLKYAVESI